MKAILLVACMALSGCTYLVSAQTWTKAEELCAANGGAVVVQSEIFVPDALLREVIVADAKVRCANGAEFEFRVNHQRLSKDAS